jgi:hypothetical protein
MPAAARKSRYEKAVKRIADVPGTVEALWQNTGEKHMDNLHFQRVRFDLLQDAGWDPGGWSAMEWARLPRRLRDDLNSVYPKFYAMLLKESEAAVAQLKAAMRDLQ